MFHEIKKPTKFDELIFEDGYAKRTLKRYATGSLRGNILLHGPYGTGKSTTARIIAEEFHRSVLNSQGYPPKIFNGSKFKFEALEKMLNDATLSGASYKYFVIDEFDLVPAKTQFEVRTFLDEWGQRVGLILTTNNLSGIKGPLQSRCEAFEMPAPSLDTLVPMCREILEQAGISRSDNDIRIAIKNRAGDIRQVQEQLAQVIAINQANPAQQTP